MSDFEVHPVGTVAALRQRAEAAERERERDEAIKRGDDAEREFYKLAARAVQLDAALRKYGRHTRDCQYFVDDGGMLSGCNCGLDAALRPAAPCNHSPTQGVGGVWECFKCGEPLAVDLGKGGGA